MNKKIDNEKDLISKEQKNINLVNSDQSIKFKPLLINQDPKKIKDKKPLQYEYGKETYEVYSNPKNPFMVGILTADTDRIKLDPVNTRNLFQQLESLNTYTVEYPQNISAHRKRKLSSQKEALTEDKSEENFISTLKVNNFSNEYLPKEKLKEDKLKLNTYIKSFFNHFLKRIKNNHQDLNLIINEITPLFVRHKIRIRFYDAFRQISNIEDLINTLEKICNDFELENFELFCSAIFVFYSSQVKK